MKINPLFITIASGVGLLFFSLSTQANPTRGLKNKNPGNIIYLPINQWQGQIGNDGKYAIFDNASNGIRAMGIILQNYFDKHNLKTIRGIISRWAPPSENITSSYINAVSQKMNILPDAIINLNLPTKLQLIKAIIHHENGSQPYSDNFINNALLG